MNDPLPITIPIPHELRRKLNQPEMVKHESVSLSLEQFAQLEAIYDRVQAVYQLLDVNRAEINECDHGFALLGAVRVLNTACEEFQKLYLDVFVAFRDGHRKGNEQ